MSPRLITDLMNDVEDIYKDEVLDTLNDEKW